VAGGGAHLRHLPRDACGAHGPDRGAAAFVDNDSRKAAKARKATSVFLCAFAALRESFLVRAFFPGTLLRHGPARAVAGAVALITLFPGTPARRRGAPRSRSNHALTVPPVAPLRRPMADRRRGRPAGVARLVPFAAAEQEGPDRRAGEAARRHPEEAGGAK